MQLHTNSVMSAKRPVKLSASAKTATAAQPPVKKRKLHSDSDEDEPWLTYKPLTAAAADDDNGELQVHRHV